MLDETRAGGDVALETRGLAKMIRGYAIVFNRLSENLGGFVERIAPEAMDRTLREKIDLRALVDHNPHEIIGRLSAGTLRVAKDERGLKIEIDPPQSPRGENIIAAVTRRDVTGMSFAFQTVLDDWDHKTTPPTRTVVDMIVREVSLVSFPAYPQTEAALRSLAGQRRQHSVEARLAVALRRRW